MFRSYEYDDSKHRLISPAGTMTNEECPREGRGAAVYQSCEPQQLKLDMSTWPPGHLTVQHIIRSTQCRLHRGDHSRVVSHL